MTAVEERNTFKCFHYDKFSRSQENLSFNPLILQTNINKIKPQPIVSRSIPNSKQLQAKLIIHGHKHFTKFAAAGPNTPKILNDLRKSPYVKSIQHFEFDPYLCDESLLPSLKKVSRHVRQATKVNIIVRRMDKFDETDQIFLLISRLLRLKKARFELSSTPNLTEDGFINLCRAFGKCVLLKSFEFSFPKLVSGVTTVKVNQYLEKMWERLIYLEERSVFISLHKNIVKKYINYQFQVRRGRSNLKSLALRYMLNKGWELAGSGNNIKLDKFLKTIEPHPRLENLKFQMIRVDISSEEIMRLMDAVKTRTQLKHFSLELLNCGLGELETVSFLYKLSAITQLENINFKLIEDTFLPEPIVFAFVEAFTRMPNLHTFIIYFRKLNLSPFETQVLENKLSNIPDIHYTNYKGSIQITKSSEIRKNSLSGLNYFNKLYI